MIDPNEAPLIWCYALETISQEFNALSEGNTTNTEYSNMCYEINYTYCRHFILKQLKNDERTYLISFDYIKSRWGLPNYLNNTENNSSQIQIQSFPKK